jgi:hypothetical protein
MTRLGQFFGKIVEILGFLFYVFLGTTVLVYVLQLQIEWPLLFTLWVAEVPIAVFLRYILGEGVQDRPHLTLESKKSTNADCYNVELKNAGEKIAEDCQASITLKKLTQEDLAETVGFETLVNRLNFHSIESVRIPCPQSIRPDDTSMLELVRVVRSDDNLHLLRLELPSEKGWNPILCALQPGNYKIGLKAGASVGKPAKVTITVKFNRKKDGMRFRLLPTPLSR